MNKKVLTIIVGAILALALLSMVAYYTTRQRPEGHHESVVPDANSEMTSVSQEHHLAIENAVASAGSQAATGPSQQRNAMSSLGHDDVAVAVREWWKAVEARDVPRVRELDKQLPLLVSRAMPSQQSTVMKSLADEHGALSSSGVGSQFQRVLLSSMIAKIAVRQYSRVPSDATTTVATTQSQDALHVKSIVYWSEAALRDMAGNSSLDADSRRYFIEVLPAVLAMLCRYSEEMPNSASALAALEDTQDGLLSLADTDVARDALQKVLQQYHTDLKTITTNGEQARSIRAVLDRYVIAYNAKDTDALRKVFHADSSAATQLKTNDAQRLISEGEWTIQSFTIKHIYVDGGRASIDVEVSYATKNGVVGTSRSASFHARRINNDNEWQLE